MRQIRPSAPAAGPEFDSPRCDALRGRGEFCLCKSDGQGDQVVGPLFRATVGGIGLSGIVTASALRLQRVPSARVRLHERRMADLERGFTAHGPHRDELQLVLDGVSLRAYGSQGQQRAALLALLFAERALLAERRARPPLMLLDDVMSELDAERRELLAALLRSDGQAVITTTEPEHVPGTALAGGGLVRVEGGTARAAPRPVAA